MLFRSGPEMVLKTKGDFFMKLTIENKIEIIKQRKKQLPYASTSLQFNICKSSIYYLWSLYKRHGDKILVSRYHYYNESFKIQAVKRVKSGETLFHTSIDLGLSNVGTLSRWIKEFDKNYGRIPKRKRGRIPMKKNKYKTNLKSNKLNAKTPEQEIKELKQQITENNEKLLYQEAEIEYLKKLEALIQA